MSHQLWNTLLRNNLSPNQLYFLDCLRYKIKPSNIIDVDHEAQIAKVEGYIDDANLLTMKALTILDEFETCLVKTKKKVATSVLGDNFLENIHKYRNIFPTGPLPHGELARQSVQELKDKFVWFFKTYPEFSWEQVLSAAHFYVWRKSNEQYAYMSTSSYFIQKMDIKTKVNKSLLADMCQAMVDDPDMINRL